MGTTPSIPENVANADIDAEIVEMVRVPTRRRESDSWSGNSDTSTPSNRPTIIPDLKFINVAKGDTTADAELEDRLAYVLDGIDWGTSSKKVYKRKFPVAFTEAMRSVDMTGPDKLVVMERYVRLVRYYQKTSRRWALFSYGSRALVAVGSVLVPVLVAVDEDMTERTGTARALAYTIVGVGFTVSLVNGFQELLQSTKQFITSSDTKRALISEGWAFVSLSGRYGQYNSHTDCWRHFFSRVQKMDAVAHNVSMSIARGEDKGPRMGQQSTGTPEPDDTFSLPVVYTKH